MASNDDKIDNLTKLVEGLKAELGEIRKKVEDGKEPDKHPKKPDKDWALLLALWPFCGLTSFGFGNPLLLPLGLRLAAARTLMLHRTLERAATISKAWAKRDDDDKSDRPEQLLKWIVSRTPDEKKAVVEMMRAFWSNK